MWWAEDTMRIDKKFNLAIRFIVAIGILGYVFRKIPLSEVFNAMTSAKTYYVLAACAASLLAQPLLSHQLKILAEKQGIPISEFQALEIHLRSIFYGLFLPGGNLTLGAIRSYQLSGPYRKIEGAIVCVIFDRIILTITVLIIGICLWWIDFRSDFTSIGISLAIVFGALLLLFTLIINQRGLGQVMRRFKRVVLDFVPRKGRELFTSLDQYKNLSLNFLALILFLSITAHLLGVLAFYFLGIALEMNLSFVTLGWIRTVVAIISMIPITISGLGVREGALILLLNPYGVSGKDTLALSFLIFGASRLSVWALGGIFEVRRLIMSSAKQL